MSMTEQDERWHKTYQQIEELAGLGDEEYLLKLEVIKNGFHEVGRLMRTAGMRPDLSDGAECLIAAITRYVLNSETTHAMRKQGS